MRIILILFFIVSARNVLAQDSLKIMTLNDLYQIVLSNHPVAKQANTLPDAAKSEIRMSRGNFDPYLSSDFDNKKFDSKNYWSIWESKLQIPVWFGADFKIAYDNNSGENLDNSNDIPANGLSYVGISMPLGQGLLIDQRRATLKIAKLSAQMAEAEKIKVINKLLLQVAKDYWDWTFSFNKQLLHEEALRLADVRFKAIRDRVLLGDLPAIDSLEAFIELQNREAILSQSRLELNNTRLIVSVHLWTDKAEPTELTPLVIPSFEPQDLDSINVEQLNILLKLSAENHPELLKLRTKLDQLEIDRRFAAEKLRPKLQLDYNFLRTGQQPWTTNGQEWRSDNNYKLGVNFSFPILLRQERGKLSLARIKIQQTDFERQQTEREINTLVQSYWNELTSLLEQLKIQEAQVLNTARMLEGELYKFGNGEGSIFLINTRENNLINSRIKLVDLKAKYAKSKAHLYWAAGRFQSEIN